MEWKLYYEDGSSFSSEDGDWLEAPPRGVVGLGIPHKDNGRQILCGDVYLLQSGHKEPQASDTFGALSHLLNVGIMTPEESLDEVTPQGMFSAGIKFGHNVDNEDWLKLWKWMVSDADTTWPKRSGTKSTRER